MQNRFIESKISAAQRMRIMQIMLIMCLLIGMLLSASAHSASKTLLVVGDSLSAEYGIARGSGWVPLLAARLQRDYPKYAVVNASISGETTSGGRTRIQPLLDKHRPAIVIVELGGNDALRGLALTASEENLRTIVESSRKAGAKVLLLGMQIPPNYGPDYARDFIALFPRIAKQSQTAFVPFFLDKVARDPALFQPDRIHPTAAAQPLMLDAVWPALKPLLEK